jgi:multisubunit Na+/H+ antiporter MnhB subunit
VTGIIVGYKSPGVTILEAAIGGIVMILFNILFVYAGLDGELPFLVVLLAMIVGFVFTLLGALLGETMQKRAQAQS